MRRPRTFHISRLRRDLHLPHVAGGLVKAPAIPTRRLVAESGSVVHGQSVIGGGPTAAVFFDRRGVRIEYQVARWFLVVVFRVAGRTTSREDRRDIAMVFDI